MKVDIRELAEMLDNHGWEIISAANSLLDRDKPVGYFQRAIKLRKEITLLSIKDDCDNMNLNDDEIKFLENEIGNNWQDELAKFKKP